jgi:zeta-carotene desaturase
MERFWKPILVSALSEDLDLISVSYAAQVVRESMKSAPARQMGVPTIPLTDLYNRAGDYIRARGGEIRTRTSIETFFPEAQGVRIRTSGGGERAKAEHEKAENEKTKEEEFDYLVLALPFENLDRVLPDSPLAAPLREQLTHFSSCPITGVHLWFDRQISELDHAVLLDRTLQWMFHKSRLLDARGAQANGEPRGSYMEFVISSSKELIDKSRGEIVDLALKEVREFFPAARATNLLKSTVIKEVRATFSPRPGIDAYRPQQTTAWPRIFLAGDWTATGWPATMEGAVRSGYLAAEALTRSAGIQPNHFVSPDLPAGGLMKLFA